MFLLVWKLRFENGISDCLVIDLTCGASKHQLYDADLLLSQHLCLQGSRDNTLIEDDSILFIDLHGISRGFSHNLGDFTRDT